MWHEATVQALVALTMHTCKVAPVEDHLALHTCYRKHAGAVSKEQCVSLDKRQRRLPMS